MKQTLEQYSNKAKERRRKRTIRHRQNQKYRGEVCPECGGIMSWCSCCNCWTRTCCVDYGTCECS